MQRVARAVMARVATPEHLSGLHQAYDMVDRWDQRLYDNVRRFDRQVIDRVEPRGDRIYVSATRVDNGLTRIIAEVGGVILSVIDHADMACRRVLAATPRSVQAGRALPCRGDILWGPALREMPDGPPYFGRLQVPYSFKGSHGLPGLKGG